MAIFIRLAQERHAPNALCMMGPVLDPLLDQQSIPPTNQEYDLIKWPCRSQIPLEDALGLFRLGKVGLAFASGAQVDKWGNLNIAIDGVRSDAFIFSLDTMGIACSSGSACAAGSAEPSHVLLSMGIRKELSKSVVRFSLSKYNTMDEINYTCDSIRKVIAKLRRNRY